MNRNRRLLALKIVVPIASLVLTLLLLEGVLRLLGLETASHNSISGFCQYDPELGWVLIPEHRTVFKGREFSALVETGAQGIRDRYYPFEREPGRKRIVVLGDSVAWCWGVDMEHCFTKLVETDLGDTDVITMGVPGYSSAQELLLYERDGTRFGADLVLLIFVGNDPVDNLEPRKRPKFVITEDGLELTNLPVARRKSRLKQWLRQNSQLFAQADFASHVAQAWLKRWREDRKTETPREPAPATRFVMPTKSEESEGLPLTLAILDRLRSRVAAEGASFAIVTFDTPEFFVRAIDEFCTPPACRFVDSSPAIHRGTAAGLHMRLLGDGHLAPEGQRVLADVVLSLLEEPGWESGSWSENTSEESLAAEFGFR